MSGFVVGDKVQHVKYGVAEIKEISPSGVRVCYDNPPEDLGGECEDIVSEADLCAVSPYSNDGTIDAITTHFNLLFKADDLICLTFIHSKNKTSTGAAVTENFFLPLSRAISKTSIARMQLRNESGDNVYVAMNPLAPGASRRRKDCAGEPRTVFMEVDESGSSVYNDVKASAASGEIPPPSTVLQSSPGKFQFIWRVDPAYFTMEKIEAVNNSLVVRFGGDPACTDHLRVFRVPALRNLKYPARPVVEVIEINFPERLYASDDFRLPVGEAKSTAVKTAAGDEELAAIIGYFEDAAQEAKLSISKLKKWGTNGYLWEITCPWVHEHTDQKDSGSVVILHKSGALGYTCRHGHCAERTWVKDFRPKLEEIVGHQVRFSDPGVIPPESKPEQTAVNVSRYAGPTSDGAVIAPLVVSSSVLPALKNIDVVSSMVETHIILPEFDRKIVKGFYSDLVGLVTEGNTLPPQFAFGVAKTIVGLRCAGQTVFAGCEKQPRYYYMLIGETGVGKGESWRRTMNILTMNNSRTDFDNIMSVFNSVDSGAGLKEAFFDKNGRGTGIPVCMYVDEVTDIGAKTRSDRNPEIMTTMLELANGTSISRVKANTKWTCNNAKLAVVICAQPTLISVAFSGSKSGELGLYDRLSPEIAYPQDIDDVLKPVEPTSAIKVSLAFDALPYASTIKESLRSMEIIKEYRASWTKEERSKARRMDHMKLDMNMLAFGRRATETEPEDALAAIYLDQRQQVIRNQYLKEEVPDKTGDYSSRIKALIRGQILAMRAGHLPDKVMLTERDFMTKTNAFRKNEEIFFKRAWQSVADTLLRVVETEAKRGPKAVRYYLPQ